MSTKTGTTRAPAASRRNPSPYAITEFQRPRIIAATIDAILDSGYAGLTVSAIVTRARLSRKTFYDLFENCDDCFTAVVEHIYARAAPTVSAAYSAEKQWLAAMRAGLCALLQMVDQEPGLARIWFLEALAGPAATLGHRRHTAAALAQTIDRGATSPGRLRNRNGLTAEMIVGGITHVISSRLATDSDEPMTHLLGELMYTIALPYLGAAKAHAELRRKPPFDSVRRQAPTRLDDVDIRLTYRTIRTLGAIDDRPGASNREIAEGCDITDQGQISKLLSRLEGHGLIENRGAGQLLGAKNAWHLTPRGMDLARHAASRELTR